jgi:hypothetical protein
LSGIAYKAEAVVRPENEMVADLVRAFGFPLAEVRAGSPWTKLPVTSKISTNVRFLN